jgi:hypothetical protein
VKKYTIDEIDQMRSHIRWSYPSDVVYCTKDQDADIENRLRTYMQNGTTVAELEKMARAIHERNIKPIRAIHERNIKRGEAELEFYDRQCESQPPPRVLKTAADVIDEWFQTCVAKYAGAESKAKELYNGLMGRTLKNFANQNAPDGVHITQKDMERYLDSKGIKSRRAMFAKRYDGIRHVIYGDVRSGNYGT